ncbi:Protein CBG06077 [Caenorhabditis briggsae]|uniref:Uncharacterized protein n=2 Tax=Caenorhabditis briggsae TaxID=6238 RepID=A0AAE9D4V7_CAEBR|nr:Protein CBG06077 [Caenorhabditis briggsae]ULT95405.1 hypothetical protein L3Y34_004260 [Caenorhabditis briggsae]UMM28617.1 hypothetical protein L5515_011380 [Caenorhabditis briggsae]CAP26296.1 Protein CBG06077 [Caenorhabditis briggsae]
MTSNSENRSNKLNEKRTSVQMKTSFSQEVYKTPIKQILTAPSQSHSRITPGGQLFLCVMGLLISVAISIWLAAFSRESGWRRAVFSSAAAICAILFVLLTIMTYKRAKNPPEPEPLPDLSQRRSTIGARVSKRSIAAGMSADSDCPTQVLVTGTRGSIPS